MSIEQQAKGKKDGEIRYLTPLNIDTNKAKKYCRFKKSGIKYIDYKDPDFLIKFKRGNVYFFNNPRDNISNNEFEIIGDNFKIRTKDEINTFEIFKIKKERFIKNNYIFSNKGKIIKFDKNNSQKNVLDNIFNKNNRKNISNIIEISYDTFKVISKIKSML